MISFMKLLFKNDAIRASVILFAILFALPTLKALAVDASILPQGTTQFLDDDGNPLSNGKVYFYTPNTLTFKTTWQNAAKSITNTNPVDLDAGGRAIIYGDGSYRQIVKDSLANTIYDAVTTAPLTGGSATLVGDGNLVSTVLPWSGLTAPAQYVFGYGQEIARATYPEFYTAITSTQTVGCTLGSPTITGLADTTQIIAGTAVELSCVAAGTTVVSKTLTTVVLSANSSASTSASAKFFPWGNGNGSTTFNVPDLRGYNLAGRDNMGGTASARLVNGNGLGRPLGIANFTYTATSPTNVTTQTFLSGSGATYTTPAGVTKIVVTMVAGGGGGGAVATNSGSVGTDSTWVISGGTNWTAIHGNGGASGGGNPGTGGTSGVDGTGTLIVRAAGGTGGNGSITNVANVILSSGFGGSTPFGVGSTALQGAPAGPSVNSGAGGGGGGGNSATGSGSGGGGGEYVRFSIPNPVSTYTYTIGTGGAGGVAGTNAGIAGAAGRIYVEEYYTTTPSTTSFTATTSGTLEQQRTINYVVKITPDTSTSIATGVASLGGMTGVITCGAGLLCTGNVINTATSSLSTAYSLFGNNTAIPAAPSALTSFIISGLGQFGTTTYVATGNYTGAITNSLLFSARGTIASPVTDQSATAVFQMVGNQTVDPGGTTVYGSYRKLASTANVGGRSFFAESFDAAGGTSSYIEGARFSSEIYNGAAAGGNTIGVVGISVGSNAFEYVYGGEFLAYNNSGTPATPTFNSSKISASVNLSCGLNSGLKCDAGAITNPFSFAKAITGFFVTAGSVEDAAFRSDASTVYGVDFTRATFSTAAFAGPSILLGGTSMQTFLSATPSIQFNLTGSDTILLNQAKWSADANGSAIVFNKSRGATVGSFTIVQSGDTIGQINFRGSNGTNVNNAAAILGQVDGTPGAADMPGRLLFSTTPDGSTTVTERMRISNTGHTNWSGTAPALTVCGTSPAITGNDMHGTVTMGTGAPTGCVITFNLAYTSAPSCRVTWRTNIASMQYTVNTTAITLVQTGTSSNLIDYDCWGT